MNQANRAGQFQITIDTVTVNGVVYNPTSLVAPSSFVLTASTGCQSTVVTASTVQNISLKVWDTISNYAFNDFSDTVSTNSGDLTLCSKTYTASI